MPLEDFLRLFNFFRSFHNIIWKPAWVLWWLLRVAATGGKLWPPAARTIPIPPVLPAGKGEAGLILTLFSIPALPTFSFPRYQNSTGLGPSPSERQNAALPVAASKLRVQASVVPALVQREQATPVLLYKCAANLNQENKYLTQALSPTG